MVQFENAALNKKFEIRGEDHQIITPEGYSGLLSKVKDETVLTGLIERGSKLVARKQSEPAKEPKEGKK